MPSNLAFSDFVPLTSFYCKIDGKPATLKLSAVNLPHVVALANVDRMGFRRAVFIFGASVDGYLMLN